MPRVTAALGDDERAIDDYFAFPNPGSSGLAMYALVSQVSPTSFRTAATSISALKGLTIHPFAPAFFAC